MRGYQWNDQETLFLKEHYYTKPVKEIAEELGLTYQQVVSKAHNLGMNRKKNTGESWSEAEDDFLRENFEYAAKAFLERGLPLRTWNAIYLRGNKTFLLERKTQDKYYIDHRSLSEWNEHAAYIAGFIMADGYVKHQSGVRMENSLQIELADYDIDILEQIKVYLKFEGPIRKTKRNTVVLNISNVRIIEDLLQAGIPENGKTTASVWLDTIPKHLIHHFVRGVFDGDGSVYRKNNRMCVQFLGTENLLQGIMKHSPTRKKTMQYRGENGGANIYCLYYSSKADAKNIYDWMYQDATIFLKRKYDKFQDFLVAEFKSRELLER